MWLLGQPACRKFAHWLAYVAEVGGGGFQAFVLGPRAYRLCYPAEGLVTHLLVQSVQSQSVSQIATEVTGDGWVRRQSGVCRLQSSMNRHWGIPPAVALLAGWIVWLSWVRERPEVLYQGLQLRDLFAWLRGWSLTSWPTLCNHFLCLSR